MKLKRKGFDQETRELNAELVKLQEWGKHKGLKVVLIFEGRYAVGKATL